MKILAAVVTHNRCELLARCLDHVLAQSRPVDAVLVVNNASTDGTLAMLGERSVTTITQENVGSAGGWHRAIEYALAENFDAIWLMDDDGYPDETALAGLVEEWDLGTACASSVVVCEDRADYFVFPFPALDHAGLPVIFRWPRKVATLSALQAQCGLGTYPFAHLFNGALISLTAVRKVGNVERDFFIFGEEVDYFFRLRSVGKVYSVLAAHHFHPDVRQRGYSSPKVYYYVKNTLILNTRYLNSAWIRHGLALLAILGRIARRNGLVEMLSYLAGRDAPAFYRAIVRGLRGQVGRDFDV